MKLLRSSFWLHSIFYTLLQRFSLFFFGAISSILLFRGLLNTENGVWSLYLMILMIFETVKQGLLRNPTIKFLGMAENAGKKEEVQFNALFINVFFTLIVLSLLLLFGSNFSQLLRAPEIQPLLTWSIVMLLLLIPFNHCEVMLQAHYRFSSIFWAYFIRQGFFFSGILVLYFFFRDHFSLINLMMLQIAALFLSSILMLYYSRDLLIRKMHLDRSLLIKMLHFGKYIFGTNLFFNLARSFDHFITASTLDQVQGKTYVSYYNLISRINNLTDMPSLAAADVLFPKNVETMESEGIEKVKYYFERMIATVMAIILPISLIIFIFPKPLVYILGGSKYMEVAPILQLTILFSLSRPVGYLFGSTLDAIGKPKVNFLVNLAFMIFSLVVNFFALRHFGGIGAAYATMVNSVFSVILMILILRKYIDLDLKNVFRYWLNVYRDLGKLPEKLKAKMNKAS